MHWRNPPKETRRDWHTTQPPRNDCVKEAHAWCVAEGGPGRFYHHYTNTRWWFEQKDDAIWFALMFTGKKGNE